MKCMILFHRLPKNDAEEILSVLFKIQHSNMSLIASTGNVWIEAVVHPA